MYELDLTTSERHALALARLGWTPAESGMLLGMEPADVSRAVDAAIEKLGAATLADAVERARQDGILR